MSYENDLVKLAHRLEDYETALLIRWIVETLNDIGMEHSEMCAITRPHSHSADCDCGRDELQEKVLKVLRDISNA